MLLNRSTAQKYAKRVRPDKESNNCSINFEEVYSFGKGGSSAKFACAYTIKHFGRCPRKWGSSGPAVVNALRKKGYFRIITLPRQLLGYIFNVSVVT